MGSTFLIKLTLLAAIISIAYSVGIYEQCAGDGFGTLPCNAGLTCFRRNNVYSSCQYSCPRNVGWECEGYYPSVPSTIAAGWDQCGGDGWVGAAVCAAGYTCYARSVFYSQCRPTYDCPPGWSCTTGVIATTALPTGPVIIPAYSQCNNIAYAVCQAGTQCFQNNANYAECRPSCPAAWACDTNVIGTTYAPTAGPVIIPAYSQCSNIGYAVCQAGTQCFQNNANYAECRPSCPATWACDTNVIATTYAPTVAPTAAPVVILPAYSQCNNMGNAVCAAGTGCFRSNANYAECRPNCPATWACETDVAGVDERCGGQGYIGVTRCAAGLNCYARTNSYSYCAASCPGVGWVC